tara:strand:- start:418 stop:1164 length:747 start_codon:yes stop_codon:yes gene_type:complete
MKITLFTSNQPRHIRLAEELRNICDELFVIQECNTIHPGKLKDFYNKSDVFQEYFKNVIDSENHIFGNLRFLKDVKTISLKMGDISMIEKSIIKEALESDLYIVFGSSWIKGWLAEYIIDNKAINIHMGVSPYYRGSSCNFWATYDKNFDKVGGTIHLLSKGIDNGSIICNTFSSTKNCRNCFDFTMNAVRIAQDKLIDLISSKEIHNIKPIIQDINKEIRYSRNSDFNDLVAKEFLDRKIDINSIRI